MAVIYRVTFRLPHLPGPRRAVPAYSTGFVPLRGHAT
jgi:hypothetical protein